jgi:hypothetical protein
MFRTKKFKIYQAPACLSTYLNKSFVPSLGDHTKIFLASRLPLLAESLQINTFSKKEPRMSKNKNEQYLVILNEKDGHHELAFLYSDLERLSRFIGFEMQLPDLDRYFPDDFWYIVSASSPREAVRKANEQLFSDVDDWEEEWEEAERAKAALQKEEPKLDPSANGAKPEITHAK